MTGFVKLYGSILDSSLWKAESAATRLVWITMHLMADSDGKVESSLPGLAHRAGVTLAECEEALAVLMAPDRRRVIATERGWWIPPDSAEG